MSDWQIWLLSGLALLAAGFASSWLIHRRTSARELRDAVRRARHAVESAEHTRDATPGEHPAADTLITEAGALLADARDAQTAQRAMRLAHEAQADLEAREPTC